MKKQSQEEFQRKVHTATNGEYSVVGEYISGHTKIKFVHNVCGFEYDADPYNLLAGHCKCPVCFPYQSKSVETNAFKKIVYNRVKDEFTVMSEISKLSDKVSIRHNNCVCADGFWDFTVEARKFLDRKCTCPFENRHKTFTSIDDVAGVLVSFHPDYVMVSKSYDYADQKLEIMCEKGHVFHQTFAGILMGNGCPFCANKKVLKGYNDYCTTHPEEAVLLKNPKEGETFLYGTRKKRVYICPDCGQEVCKTPIDAFSSTGRLVCTCNDGVSYPEKFFAAVLRSLNIEYVYQLTSSTYEWCGSYRYDFYLPKFNLVVEIHGLQHYDSKNYYCQSGNVLITDKIKENLAIANHVNYLVIDARYSSYEFIKNNIICSQLSAFIDFSKVDWKSCNKKANNSKFMEVVNLWNKHEFTVVQISKQVGLSSTTCMRYLENASQSGLCDFDRIKYRKEVNHGNP